jgi:hypothetical protein
MKQPWVDGLESEEPLGQNCSRRTAWPQREAFERSEPSTAGVRSVSIPQTPTPSIADPKKNPSYPQRVHLHEKAHWLEVLGEVKTKLAGYRTKLEDLGSAPNRLAFEKLYAQMLGSEDQVAAAVKRLPQETGHLYEEDHHRVDDALAALDRLVQKWEAASKAG